MTGILATMPYIALQLVGIQAVLEVVGLGGGDNVLAKDLPLLHRVRRCSPPTPTRRGLRAPAVIAFVKDTLIYLVIIVAIIYLPHEVRRLGAHLRRRADQDGRRPTRPTGKPTGVVHPRRARSTGPTPRWRSARRWRCSCTRTRSPPALSLRQPQHDPPQRGDPAGVLASCSACSPCSAGSRSRPAPSRSALDGKPNPQLVIPQLFEDAFPALVRRRRLRGDRDRGARAGGDHVDRGGQPLHPQHLQGVAQARRDRRSRRPRSPSSSRWSSSSFALVFVLAARQAERHQLPAARRHLDPADASRRSCSASTPGGSTAGRCSPAGRSAWSTAPGRRTTSPTRRPA